jgi:hypothetical protein
MAADEARLRPVESGGAADEKNGVPVHRLLRVARREVQVDKDLKLGDELRITCEHDGEVLVQVKTFISEIAEQLHDRPGHPLWIKRVFIPKIVRPR